MKHLKTRVLLSGFSVAFFLAASLLDQSAASRQNTPPKASAREDAYRANNIGVALLEQYKHKEAADAFKRALQLEPGLALARINLGIALFNVPDLPAAQRELQSAATAAPNAPQPHYVLGLLAKLQNRPAEAIASFQKVLAIDPQDVGANVNIGQLYAQQRKYPEAIAVLRLAIAAEPYNTTALYNLGTALIRGGQREEGQTVIQQFQVLRERGSGTTLGTNYLEQGRYAEAVASTGAEPELVDKNIPDVKFTDVTATVLPGGDWAAASTDTGAVVLFDYDLDGDLDLLEVAGKLQRLARNDGGKFVNVTAQAGTLAKAATADATAAIAGDYDNDGRPDLFILRAGSSTLYHNDGNGSFSDVTAAAKIPNQTNASRSVAFVDYDHDGDIDIFIPGLLLRNNGDRTFTDQTAEARLAEKVTARAVVPTDFDNRRDVDLLVAAAEKVSLWRNLRDGSFRDVASEVGLGEVKGSTSVAAGDVNKDGFTDFYFSSSGFALSNGKERFQLERQEAAANASQFLDYDNDGLLDLVTSTNNGIRILRNTGNTFVEVKTGIESTPSQILASGDLDSDGDTDLIFGVPAGALRVARNDGGNANRSLRVGLAGRVSNRTGVGAKIEIRSGSLAQKLETYS
ncbi:MAG TPA: FG-GAP-like repeat-containing protein, partial [Pyrinomonadaceae bacterium]|nr:FG-GAP-like repeat-containing protein [Pyrinomonadaceae bacterium]